MMIRGLKPRLGAGASLRTRSRAEPALQGGDTREGFALLAVLWTLTAVTMLTGAAMAVARLGSTTTRNRVLLTRAAWAREACGEILQARWASPTARPTPSLDTVDLGRGTWCTAALEDPSVKLNLNLADRAALVTVLQAVVRRSAPVDSLVDANVTAIELEVPTACLTQGKGTIIGGWTTASLPATRALGSVTPGLDGAQQVSGGYVQVSRLGMPLVNEVVIGLKDKNKFNNSEPKDDAQFADYVTNPTLPALLEILFGGAGVKAPTNFPRTDLVAAFLTGVQGLNQPANVVASEMLRLNTAVAPVPAASQNRLGVLGGDNAGFPNGRRPGDDVVDIELRVAMGVLCTLNIGGCKPSDAPAGSLHYTDGAFIYAGYFAPAFPYLQPPLPGSPNPDNAIPRAAR